MRLSDGWQVGIALTFFFVMPCIIGAILAFFHIIDAENIGAFWLIGCLLQIFFPPLITCIPVYMYLLEELCDKFQPEHDPHIGKIKDLSAAAVLISSITALAIGLIIFLPYLKALLW